MILFWLATALMGTSVQNGPSLAGEPVSVSFTPEERAYLEKKGEITYCADPYWMPFEAITNDGKHIGISADILEILSKRGNIKFRLIPTESWSETVTFADQRKCDMISLAAATPQRLTFLNFTSSFFEVQSVVATLMHRPFVDNIREILDKKLGVIRGYSHVELLKRIDPNAQIVEIDNYHEGLIKVQSGDLYGVIGNMASIGYSIQKEKMNNVKIAGRLEGDVFLSIASRNDEPLLGSILEKLVQTLTESEKQAIMNKWMGVRYEHTTNYSLLVKILVVFVIVGIGFGIWLAKLRQLNQRLKLVNSQLEDLNTQKDYYFSVIGHDLRNPFMAILGYSESLKNDLKKLEPHEISTMAGIINNRASQVLEMLNQLLEWAKLELNQFQRNPQSINLHDVTRVVLSLYDFQASNKGIRLINEVPTDAVLELDQQMIATLLRNLVSNAVKYSDRGQAVSVTFDPTTRVLAVKDEGAGMDEQTIAEIFSLRPGKSTAGTAHEQGTGLGLTICRRYAAELNAVLDVESKPGKGSAFYVRFS